MLCNIRVSTHLFNIRIHLFKQEIKLEPYLLRILYFKYLRFNDVGVFFERNYSKQDSAGTECSLWKVSKEQTLLLLLYFLHSLVDNNLLINAFIEIY